MVSELKLRASHSNYRRLYTKPLWYLTLPLSLFSPVLGSPPGLWVTQPLDGRVTGVWLLRFRMESGYHAVGSWYLFPYGGH